MATVGFRNLTILRIVGNEQQRHDFWRVPEGPSAGTDEVHHGVYAEKQMIPIRCHAQMGADQRVTRHTYIQAHCPPRRPTIIAVVCHLCRKFHRSRCGQHANDNDEPNSQRTLPDLQQYLTTGSSATGLGPPHRRSPNREADEELQDHENVSGHRVG